MTPATYWRLIIASRSIRVGEQASVSRRSPPVGGPEATAPSRLQEGVLSIPANLGAPSGVPSGVSGTIAGSVLPLRRAEELISTLPGVLSVRIVPNDTGAIDEVHVLTTDAVPPKSTVRNIESALIAELGLRVNHRKISIATTLDSSRLADAPRVPETAPQAAAPTVTPSGAPSVASAPPAAPAAPVAAPPAPAAAPVAAPVAAPAPAPAPASVASEGRRVLIFEDVEVRRSRTKGVQCRVTLSRDDARFVGESEGQESERSRVELAARAAVQAIADAASTSAGSERALALEGAKRIDAFDRQFAFVSVAARIGRESVVLTGSCEIRESAETSAVLAVLDATNRWLHLER